MALIICPECGNKVSSEAEACIHCGYPMKKENFTGLYKIMLKDCSHNQIDCIKLMLRLTGHNLRESRNITDNLHEPKEIMEALSKSDASYVAEQFSRIGCIVEIEKDFNNIVPKCIEHVEYQISKNGQTPENNTPKCPTCGSTNIKKISSTAKVTNTVLFGIFGNKRKKQYHCESCGYEW